MILIKKWIIKILLFLMLVILALPAGFATESKASMKVAITVPHECWVVFISKKEAKGQKYGWWSVWHEKKKKGDYLITTLSGNSNYNLLVSKPKGSYIAVIFHPNANYERDKSDGIVLESLDISENNKKKDGDTIYLSYKKSDFKEWNCLSCPWLYVYDGQKYVRESEVIKDLAGIDYCATSSLNLSSQAIHQGRLKIKISEEKQETSYLDQIILKIDGQVYYPHRINGEIVSGLKSIDKNYIILKKGESIELEFLVPESVKDSSKIVLLTNGYYIPGKKYLQDVYQRILKK